MVSGFLELTEWRYGFSPFSVIHTPMQYKYKKTTKSGYGVACWQHQFSSITEVKQHVPALVVGWVAASVKPFELRPLVL